MKRRCVARTAHGDGGDSDGDGGDSDGDGGDSDGDGGDSDGDGGDSDGDGGDSDGDGGDSDGDIGARGTPPLRASGLLRIMTGAEDGAGHAVLRRLSLLNTKALRAAHSKLAAAVAATDWRWDNEGIAVFVRAIHIVEKNVSRFAAAYPHAACRLAIIYASFSDDVVMRARCALAALPLTMGHVRVVGSGYRRPDFVPLDTVRFGALHTLRMDGFFADATLTYLPPTLINLVLRRAPRATTFSHLPCLRTLDVARTAIGDDAVASLPPSLERLCVSGTAVSADVQYSHLPRLTDLRVCGAAFGAAALASLPPTVTRLDVRGASLSAAPRFDHLRDLRALRVDRTSVDNASLASAPCSLRCLTVSGAKRLTVAVRFSHLPRMRILDVSCTAVSDAAFASMPPSLRKVDIYGTLVSVCHRARHLPLATIIKRR